MGFKNRTIGFWIGFIGTIIMLAANVLFIIIDYGDRTFSFITFGLILLGVIGEILVVYTAFQFTTLIPAVCFGVALSMHLYLGFPTLSDVVNGVNFVGGNPKAVIQFGVMFLIGTICALTSNFMNQSKQVV